MTRNQRNARTTAQRKRIASAFWPRLFARLPIGERMLIQALDSCTAFKRALDDRYLYGEGTREPVGLIASMRSNDELA